MFRLFLWRATSFSSICPLQLAVWKQNCGWLLFVSRQHLWCSKEVSASTLSNVKAMPKSCAKTSKVGEDAVASEILRRGAKKAVLKCCKTKIRAKHYAKPDEHVTFSALEKAMNRKLAAHKAPKQLKFEMISCCHHVLEVFKFASKCFVGVLKFFPKIWLNRANLSCTKEFGP